MPESKPEVAKNKVSENGPEVIGFWYQWLGMTPFWVSPVGRDHIFRHHRLVLMFNLRLGSAPFWGTSGWAGVLADGQRPALGFVLGLAV